MVRVFPCSKLDCASYIKKFLARHRHINVDKKLDIRYPRWNYILWTHVLCRILICIMCRIFVSCVVSLYPFIRITPFLLL